MDSQFGLINLWTQGDIVTRGVGAAAAGDVAGVLDGDHHQGARPAPHTRRRRASTESFWHSADFADGLNKLGKDPANPFRALALEGREATAHHHAQPQLHDTLDVSDWLTRSLRNSHRRIHRAPAVRPGRPGVGRLDRAVRRPVRHRLGHLPRAAVPSASAGQATIDKVAGPIGEALIMTALGLAVAIPAVLGYNALVRGNKSVLSKLNRFAHDLHAYFVTGARVSAGGARPTSCR